MHALAFPKSRFIAFTENTPTSVSAILLDADGPFAAKIYLDDGKLFATCDGMPKTKDSRGDQYSTIERLVWEFDFWVHAFFEGACLTKTRIQWNELEKAYWQYLKKYQPGDLSFFKSQYKRATS